MREWKPILFALLFIGCKSPFDRTRDASNGGGTGTISGKANLVVFSNELVTGGGAFEFPGGENQSLTFTDTSNPISHRSIRYSWTGGPVTNLGCPAQSSTTLAGFDLQHAVNLSDYATSGRDLHAAGYGRVTFYARGSLSTNTVIKIEVASAGAITNPCVPPNSACVTLFAVNSNPAASPPVDACLPLTNPFAKTALEKLTTSWQQYNIPIINPNLQLADVRDLFKATFVFTPPPSGAPAGQGGEVFFDQIQYEP